MIGGATTSELYVIAIIFYLYTTAVRKLLIASFNLKYNV